MNTTHTARRSERGAVLIMVVVAMVALLAFGAFVIDYGVMWTSRGQVQTSADAGALAGAIALAFDSPTDFAGAKTKAQAVARANNVWGQAPDVQLTDVTFPPCPPGAPGLPDTCVKVDAFRNQARGNPLPMYLRQPRRRRGSGRAGDRHRADRHRQQDRLPEAVGDPRPLERVRSRGPRPAADVDATTSTRTAKGRRRRRKTTSTSRRARLGRHRVHAARRIRAAGLP